MYYKNTCCPIALFPIILIIIMSLCFSGCASAPSTEYQMEQQSQINPTEQSSVEQFERHLKISLTVDEDVKTAKYSSKELGGNFTEGLNYLKVTDVNIEIDGESLPLTDALSKNLVNEEDIFYYARLDARNGICEEVYESKLGLTHFTYCYPEYYLRLIYDIYETPDGENRLISDIAFYPPDVVTHAYTLFHTEENIPYDFEDWGIDFTVSSASPTGITFSVTQSGGQQIGQLMLDSFAIFSEDGTALEKLDGTAVAEALSMAITMDGTTEIMIDWSEVYAPLPSGHYILWLKVDDNYNESDLHPLMRNYYNHQVYTFDFNIE